MHIRFWVVLSFLVVTTCLLAGSAAGQVVITDLGTLEGDLASRAAAINASGQVVGRSLPHVGEHAFLWEGGTMSGLAPLSGCPSAAYGINDAGHVVGWAEADGGSRRGFIYTGDEIIPLGTLGGPTSTAYGINNLGQVAGSSDLDGGGMGAFLWDNYTMTGLATLGGAYTEAYAVNDAGQVVGHSDTGHGSHACLWYDDSVTDLGTLGGRWSFARAINDAGQVVGYSDKGLLDGAAFLWQDGAMTDLGTLGGWWAQANGINDDGVIVGTSHTGLTDEAGDPIVHAFIYDDGAMSDLNDVLAEGCGWELLAATGINDAGQIVGWGTHGGDLRGFLLAMSGGAPDAAPIVPEPSTVLLIVLGALGLTLKKRRRR